jgi:hypothetical protein
MRPYIYLVKNQQNKIVYIGQQIGTKSIEEYKGSGLLLNRAYKKYGENHFKREIIEYCDINELNDKEKSYIKQYNTKFPHGYNLTDGGDGMKGYQYNDNQKRCLAGVYLVLFQLVALPLLDALQVLIVAGIGASAHNQPL